ncbi:MAG TPA: dTMP kinase [Actinobacteria bacterium]|nr:dTMP kinase [Actinomycetota bacterium]
MRVATDHYVAFEGIEGVGKSTVAAAVAATLRDRGDEAVEVREPGGTATGERIRSILLGDGTLPAPWTEALLFAAARAQLAVEVVGPALARGAWVISDRSVYSSLAYQGVGRGLGIDAVRAVNEPGLGGLWPGRVVVLDAPAELGMARQGAPDRIGGEGPEFMERVREAFLRLVAEEPGRFVVVDATRPLDEVVAAVVAEVLG